MFTFVETTHFNKILYDYLSDKEYQRLQIELIKNPRKGDVIPGSGGFRKIRYSARGKGKSGGVRIIYYLVSAKGKIYLFDIYSKGEREDLTKDEINMLKKLVEKGIK